MNKLQIVKSFLKQFPIIPIEYADKNLEIYEDYFLCEYVFMPDISNTMLDMFGEMCFTYYIRIEFEYMREKLICTCILSYDDYEISQAYMLDDMWVKVRFDITTYEFVREE